MSMVFNDSPLAREVSARIRYYDSQALVLHEISQITECSTQWQIARAISGLSISKTIVKKIEGIVEEKISYKCLGIFRLRKERELLHEQKQTHANGVSGQ